MYDPTQSKSFVEVFGTSYDPTDHNNPLALQALEDSYGMMVDDICYAVQEALSHLDEPTDLQWLIEYMSQHYAINNTHFEWR